MRSLKIVGIVATCAALTVASQASVAQQTAPAASTVTAVSANDEFSVAVREYLKLTNAQAQHSIVIGFMTDTVVRAARGALGESLQAKPMQANKQQDANLVMGKNFGEFADGVRKSLAVKYSWAKMVEDIYIPAYRKQFSVTDMQAANTFYKSPVGRKVIELGPQIIVDASKTMGERYSPQLSKEYSGQVEELVKKIRAEFDKLEK